MSDDKRPCMPWCIRFEVVQFNECRHRFDADVLRSGSNELSLLVVYIPKPYKIVIDAISHAAITIIFIEKFSMENCNCKIDSPHLIVHYSVSHCGRPYGTTYDAGTVDQKQQKKKKKIAIGNRNNKAK